LNISRQGKSTYNRVNFSWNVADFMNVHLSGGISYVDFISIFNGDSLNLTGNSYNNYLSPDFSLGFDYRIKNWITFHATASYGSTFTYADNIIRKEQLVLAARVAPFINSEIGFLNSFRIEFAFLHANFNDAKESITGPIGYLYWQWQKKQ